MSRAARSRIYRGQSARVHEAINRSPISGEGLLAVKPLCEGRLTIRLEGPAGCGKSLVRKVLMGVLGLLPLDTFVIVTKQD